MCYAIKSCEIHGDGDNHPQLRESVEYRTGVINKYKKQNTLTTLTSGNEKDHSGVLSYPSGLRGFFHNNII
jgi:hypothetical protein